MKAIRSSCLTFTGDPFLANPASCFEYIPDALIRMEAGKIIAVDAYDATAAAEDDIVSYPDALVMAGFVDCHVHYPQTQMIGAFGEHLLEWLNAYTFVAEQQFADKTHADAVAKVFLRELLRAGTTTAAVYCTVHPQSVDAFFEESARFNTRMIAGKVMMDRNAPDALLDTAETGYAQSKALLLRRASRRPPRPSNSKRPAGSGRSIRAPTCRPISARRRTRSRGSGRSSRSAPAISTSITTPG